jgi:hypothetical protein
MVEKVVEIEVSCYAGYRGEESPLYFFLAGRKIVVEKILEQWRTPDSRYFRIVGDDRNEYLIRHGGTNGNWQMLVSG